ncbi:Nickel-dependent hydrogenase large subunit [Candidatus Zixiibacteriota bacterium]|nr:Nickel-dependent hydrogenase large subunit [candidate division Zixibacteria bacterium]
MRSRTIKVDALARVEGEGGLFVKIKNRSVVDVRLNIYEPPRFFEAFLRGRMYSEAPDITARICGICPIAYQMSSVTAMESAFGVKVEGQLHALRRLIYCGEWIESHALHIYLLHAPDFLGYEDAIRMAKDYPEAVEKALKLKKIGNDLMILLGGREIHPINVKVGGFYRVPTKKELQPFVERLKWARDFAVETTKLVSGFAFPDLERDYEFVALRHPDEYPLVGGRLVSSKGLDISLQEYEKHFEEIHVQHSTSLHSQHLQHGEYLVGPMARFNLNYNQLSPMAKQAAIDVKLKAPVLNPFKSIIVRAVETVFACEEALRIIDQYEMPEHPSVEIIPRAGVGCGASEAPRGTLYHRYRLDNLGHIADAKIVPPTSQNQKVIESDLREFVGKYMGLSNDKLTWQCEQAVRNYDPCISCSCHFLKLKIERE